MLNLHHAQTLSTDRSRSRERQLLVPAHLMGIRTMSLCRTSSRRFQRALARLDADSLLSMLSILSPVWPFLPMAHSGNCSLKLPGTREKLGRASRVEHHRDHRRRQPKRAGRTLQTFGSTCDVIGLGQASHHGCEIYANTVLRVFRREFCAARRPTGFRLGSARPLRRSELVKTAAEVSKCLGV